METLLYDIMIALAMGLLGAIVFAAIGLVSGTDETATLAPLTLLVRPARHAAGRRVHVLPRRPRSPST